MGETKVAELLTTQDMVDGRLDVQTLKEAVNEDKMITPRIGQEYASVPMASRLLVENGLLGARPFSTYAKMTAPDVDPPLVDGDYAIVANDDELVKNGFYEKTPESWVFLKWNPVLQAQDYTDSTVVDAVSKIPIYTDIDAPSVVYAITDSSGNVVSSIDDEGVTTLAALKVGSDTSLLSIESAEFVYAITDSSGNVVFGIKKDGTIYPSNTNSSVKSDVNINLQKTDWMHVNTYGQSLSRGSGSRPVVSTTQSYNNLTFTSGVLPRLSDAQHDYTGTKPLIEERWDAAGAEGESPTSGMANEISKLGAADSADFILFGASSGQGGMRLEYLNKGTKRYLEQLAMYQAAYALAQARNLSYSVSFIGFVQGESNYNADTTRIDYKNMLVQLKRDFDTDIKLITKQAFSPVMVTYQTASHFVAVPRRDNPVIAYAQWDAHRENNDIVMACAMYELEYLSDNLHLTADSSQQLGRYLGKAAYHMWRYTQGLTDKPFRPLEPTAIIWQDKLVDITFKVPVGSLTLDTTLVTQTSNYGFDVWVGDVLQPNAITSVTVIDGSRVRIVLDKAYSDASISYARGRSGNPASSGPINGARGNLRDQAGDTDNYVDSLGFTRYMHNWLIIFELKQGEVL